MSLLNKFRGNNKKFLMKLLLHTEGWYDSSHALKDYEGKCSSLHGHTYKCKVWVCGDESQLQNNGILWDFGNLKKITDFFDHRCLNVLFNDVRKINSTAENQCLYVYKKLKENHPNLKFKVRIYEQLEPKKSWCECGDF